MCSALLEWLLLYDLWVSLAFALSFFVFGGRCGFDKSLHHIYIAVKLSGLNLTESQNGRGWKGPLGII